MFDAIYGWIRDLTFYLVMITAVVQIVPNQGYRKYVRFFTGLLLILFILTPIFRIFGTDVGITNIYENPLYAEELEKMEAASESLENVQPADYLGEAVEAEESSDSANQIEVEEIQIGR